MIKNDNFPSEIMAQTGRQDNRNVIDHYKYWSEEAIRADLDSKRHPFAVIAENFAHDFNISTLMRNANAFLAQELWVVGRRTWDNRGSMGANHYQRVRRSRQLSDALQALDNYQPIVIDNLPGAEPLEDFVWPNNPLMIFGQESIGVSPPALEAAHSVVYIPQYGSVRSLNVGVASGIAMHHFVTQWRQKQG
jgi:tRNA G18 (ribose-2'-O)-methylase SpoU